jgi:hypothetical protein
MMMTNIDEMPKLSASPETSWVKRYPIPIQLPAQMAALTAAPGRNGLTLIAAAPAKPAAMGFTTGRNRAPSWNTRS